MRLGKTLSGLELCLHLHESELQKNRRKRTIAAMQDDDEELLFFSDGEQQQQQQQARVSLAIVPLSVVNHWETEAKRLGGFDSIVVYHGAGRQTKLQKAVHFKSSHVLVITTLATFWWSSGSEIAELMQNTDRVVIDEVQDVRNGGQYSHVEQNLTSKSGGKAAGLGQYAWLTKQLDSRPGLEIVLLTGTPVVAQRNDLRNELKLVTRSGSRAKRLLGDVRKWQPVCSVERFRAVQERFVIKMTGGGGEGDSELDIEKVTISHSLTAREKEAAIAQHQKVTKAGAKYQAARARHAWSHASVQAAMKSYEAAKQAYRRGLIHDAFYEGMPEEEEEEEEWTQEERKIRRAAWLDSIDPAQSSRLVTVADAILACPHPIALFCEWTEPLLLLQRLLVTHGLAGGVISTFFGGLAAKKRSQIIKRFNAGQVRVLLATTGAGGRGINLVGGRIVCLLNEHLSAAAEAQALGRVTRPAAQGRDGKWWLWRATTTDDTATVENVYASQLKKWKVAQASSEEGSDDVERGSMAFAVPSLTLKEANEKQALAVLEGKEKQKKKGEKRKQPASVEPPSLKPTAVPLPPPRPKVQVARPASSSSSSSSSRPAPSSSSASSSRPAAFHAPLLLPSAGTGIHGTQSQRPQAVAPRIPAPHPPARIPHPRSFEAWKKQRLDRQEATASMRKLDQLLTQDILRHREQQKKRVQMPNHSVIDLC